VLYLPENDTLRFQGARSHRCGQRDHRRPDHSIADKTIADDVRAATERNININIEDVTIWVEGGVVALSGTVPNWTAARRAALSAAELTRGVVDIIDDMAIRTAPAMPAY